VCVNNVKYLQSRSLQHARSRGHRHPYHANHRLRRNRENVLSSPVWTMHSLSPANKDMKNDATEKRMFARKHVTQRFIARVFARKHVTQRFIARVQGVYPLFHNVFRAKISDGQEPCGYRRLGPWHADQEAAPHQPACAQLAETRDCRGDLHACVLHFHRCLMMLR
jgi:hypothetical protein